MSVEGINLYTKLVKVFSVKKQYLAYTAVGWGDVIFHVFLLIFLILQKG